VATRTQAKDKGAKTGAAEKPAAEKRSRTYSDRERAEALAVLDAVGGVVARAAKMTGVPEKTLSGWAEEGRVKPEVLEEKKEIKAALYDRIETLAGDIIGLMVRRVKDDILADRKIGFSEASVALGVLIDKMEKLRGMPGGGAGPGQTPSAGLTPEQKQRQAADLLEQGRQSLSQAV
jgi:transposase-like protein